MQKHTKKWHHHQEKVSPDSTSTFLLVVQWSSNKDSSELAHKCFFPADFDQIVLTHIWCTLLPNYLKGTLMVRWDLLANRFWPNNSKKCASRDDLSDIIAQWQRYLVSHLNSSKNGMLVKNDLTSLKCMIRLTCHFIWENVLIWNFKMGHPSRDPTYMDINIPRYYYLDYCTFLTKWGLKQCNCSTC